MALKAARWAIRARRPKSTLGLRAELGCNAPVSRRSAYDGTRPSADLHQYPPILSHLLSADGDLGAGWLLFLGGQDVTALQGMQTPVALEEVLNIVPDSLRQVRRSNSLIDKCFGATRRPPLAPP